MTKKILITLIVLGGIISAGYFGAGTILAQSSDQHDTLITRIAQKFNLNQSDVEAVFQTVRDERQVEMKTQKEARLSNAVTDGVITEAQKNTILAKMQEHLGERGQNREEMQTWFAEQGIDHTKLSDYLGFGGNRGRGMGFGPGM